MALVLLNAGDTRPLGQFDGYDSVLTSFKGGEVCTWIGVNVTAGDKAAADVTNDGYVGTVTKTRPAVTFNLANGARPLFLADDGTSGYGTLFGQVVGGSAGSSVSGGAQLGPHTATGSGKVTLWANPGLYGVTLDACDTNASTGLQPTNSTLTVGAPLYATATGLLTPNSGAAFESVVVGRFAEFSTGDTLVTTPNSLTDALVQKAFKMAVFYFTPNV